MTRFAQRISEKQNNFRSRRKDYLYLAQILKQRYPAHVKLWHYQAEDYVLALSNVELDLPRLNSLQKISQEELLPVRNLMLEKKRAGYQEELVNLLVEDIKGIY